uniref:cellulose binding domain-containing protein n=1 Tax=Acrocarpospora macrocephala TaxID=150177 RepID=UPI0035A241A1
MATYRITNQWPGGFGGEVVVRNSGSVGITGWTVRWTFANGQTISNLWNGTPTQTGANVSVRDAGHNGTLAVNATGSFGFNGTWSGTNTVPAAVTCTPA